ncbi:MAG: hypothetical protein JWQ90_4394 [Hydrocarboniphaga sp.]|uniref:hypothetical protein n=1 Tax=Hydrocarboniphaga sp. TaxID=2033016 RepID=UPI0026303DF5|nr:hypothetical protein [Hydrocarboniphaga sp.]MDB5971944.1 hypothetical protein [Hydrocarboniphaga sp.]
MGFTLPLSEFAMSKPKAKAAPAAKPRRAVAKKAATKKQPVKLSPLFRLLKDAPEDFGQNLG